MDMIADGLAGSNSHHMIAELSLGFFRGHNVLQLYAVKGWVLTPWNFAEGNRCAPEGVIDLRC